MSEFNTFFDDKLFSSALFCRKHFNVGIFFYDFPFVVNSNATT